MHAQTNTSLPTNQHARSKTSDLTSCLSSEDVRTWCKEVQNEEKSQSRDNPWHHNAPLLPRPIPNQTTEMIQQDLSSQQRIQLFFASSTRVSQWHYYCTGLSFTHCSHLLTTASRTHARANKQTQRISTHGIIKKNPQ